MFRSSIVPLSHKDAWATEKLQGNGNEIPTTWSFEFSPQAKLHASPGTVPRVSAATVRFRREKTAYWKHAINGLQSTRTRFKETPNPTDCLAHGFSQPPLTAGTIEISDPAKIGLASPPKYRIFSSPMKILMCSRTCPCSVAIRSRTPG